MKFKKAIRKLLLVILVLSILVLPGCIYSHNYDEDGNEMNKEQVDETLDDIKESIEAEINDAFSPN